MRSIQKKSRIGKKYVVTVIAFIIAVLTSYILFSANNAPNLDPTPEEVKPAPAILSDEDAQAKERFINENSKNVDAKDTPTKDNQISAVVENGKLIITSKLYTITNGECRLVIKNDANEIVRSAQVIYQPSYSSCAGFSIEKSNLITGTWSILLTVESINGVTSTLETTAYVEV